MLEDKIYGTALIVAGFIASLNTASTPVAIFTPVAVFMGVVERTIGQTPVVPGSAISFLQPAANTTIINMISHLLLKRFEKLRDVRAGVLPAEVKCFIIIGF